MKFLRENTNVYQFLFFLFTYVPLQLAFSSGASLQQKFNLERGILAVENRVSLDLAHLLLPNPELNVAGNVHQVRDYLHKLNDAIAQQALPVVVASLQDVEADLEHSYSGEVLRQLSAPEQIVRLRLNVREPSWSSRLSGYPLLLAAILLLLLRPYLKSKSVGANSGLGALARVQNNSQHIHQVNAQIQTPARDLVLDLSRKELSLTNTEKCVALANKPLCFYAALLDYCQQHPQVRLCQHKLLPEELVELADKYFLRLVALGHTIRKRPDFNNNLEKNLSEIRAALDELFTAAPELKDFYYPPKARGEGSRSKTHSFALTQLPKESWQITGK